MARLKSVTREKAERMEERRIIGSSPFPQKSRWEYRSLRPALHPVFDYRFRSFLDFLLFERMQIEDLSKKVCLGVSVLVERTIENKTLRFLCYAFLGKKSRDAFLQFGHINLLFYVHFFRLVSIHDGTDNQPAATTPAPHETVVGMEAK